MKVLVIVKATQASEAGIMPDTELLTAMGNYNNELIQAGIMLDGVGLTPSSRGARVRFSGTSRTVIDGPFAETKELIAGFWIWKVRSLQEAIDWVKKCPNPMFEDSDIEIRPFFEVEDFGDALTPQLREQEAAQKAKILGLNPPTFQQSGNLIIAGLNRSYTMETRVGIPQQWEQFVPQAAGISSQASTDFYGVCWNHQPDCSFDYLTGVEIRPGAKTSEGHTTVNLPAARYAVFTHTAHVSSLPKTIDAIWSKWVPECGLAAAEAPCFERYTSEFNPRTGMGGMEIWIPLRP